MFPKKKKIFSFQMFGVDRGLFDAFESIADGLFSNFEFTYIFAADGFFSNFEFINIYMYVYFHCRRFFFLILSSYIYICISNADGFFFSFEFIYFHGR